MPGPWEKYRTAPPQGNVFSMPDPEAQQRMANEQERLRMAHEAEARAGRAESRANTAQQAELYTKGLRMGPRGIEQIPGWTGGTQGAKVNQVDMKQAALEALTNQINEVQRQFDANFTGANDRGIFEYAPTPTNKAFDSAAAGLSEQALGAFRVPGVGSQSDAELKAFVDANKPDSWQYDAVNQQRLNNIRNRLDATRKGMGLGPSAPGANAQYQIEQATNLLRQQIGKLPPKAQNIGWQHFYADPRIKQLQGMIGARPGLPQKAPVASAGWGKVEVRD